MPPRARSHAEPGAGQAFRSGIEGVSSVTKASASARASPGWSFGLNIRCLCFVCLIVLWVGTEATSLTLLQRSGVCSAQGWSSEMQDLLTPGTGALYCCGGKLQSGRPMRKCHSSFWWPKTLDRTLWFPYAYLSKADLGRREVEMSTCPRMRAMSEGTVGSASTTTAGPISSLSRIVPRTHSELTGVIRVRSGRRSPVGIL